MRVSVPGTIIGPAFGETGTDRDGALPFVVGQFLAVDVILLVIPAAEVEQRRAKRDGTCAGDGGALLDEASHGCDAGTGSDHDDWHRRIGREVESGVRRADKAVDTATGAEGCEVGGGDAVECSRAAGARGGGVHVVGDACSEDVLSEVMLFGQWGRGDGVLSRCQGFEHVDI